MLKAAAAGMRYFARSNFMGSLVHKDIFGLILQGFLKLEYLFVKGVGKSLLSLNEFEEKWKATYCYWIIFVEHVFHWLKFKARSHDIFLNF